jgi:hypothetical protein
LRRPGLWIHLERLSGSAIYSIYTDLAEQYRRMSPLSTKRNVLAEHLKEVIDTMEQKVSSARSAARQERVCQRFCRVVSRPTKSLA